MSSPDIPERYHLLGLLGEGGSGRVYRVHDAIRARDLALKLVTPAESSFLRREFDTLRQIRHENLIQVFDWGSLESGEAYYTMELVEGEDWGARMGKPQPADEVRRILTGLLRGLAHLHCHGEIHGDVKPGNVLLGVGGVLKLTDVGMGGGEGAAAGVSGTPGYAAPEVWEGARADVRSDLYSVGVMAYEALTGSHPFQGRTIREVVSGQLEGWVPSPAAHRVSVPPDLERIMMRALERDRGLRQGSADEFMEAMGVGDRIGVILGGKLVSRRGQIERILGLASGNETGGPTLAHIVGPRGSGRTELMAELGWALTGAGCQVHSVGPGLQPSLLAGLAAAIGVATDTTSGDDAASLSRTVARLAEGLWELGTSTPQAILCDPSLGEEGATADVLAPLARFLWALSIERSRPARVLFVVAGDELRHEMESFESFVQLEPFDREGVREQVRGLLGTVRIEEAFLERLHALTGGSPGLVRAAVAEFLDRGVLVRRDGLWTFHEIEQIKDLELKSSDVTWLLGLRQLVPEERFFLEALTLVRAGIAEAVLRDLEASTPGAKRREALRAKGWLAREENGRWRLQSDAIREAVASSANPGALKSAARLLLERAGSVLSREERADLVILGGGEGDALREGLWAAGEAAGRGDLRLAQRRFETCLSIARRAGDTSALQEATLLLADVLRKLGQSSAALGLLRASNAGLFEQDNSALNSRHEFLHGLVLRSVGEMDEAREHLQRAAELAERQGNEQMCLRVEAELAEIDWGHGGEAGFADAISRIQRLLGREWHDASLIEERAALTYGLGAALIKSARRREAAMILASAFGTGCSDYWKMRIANALGAAANGRSMPDEALRWLDTAWGLAEQSGADSFKPRILSNRGSSLCALGRYRDALEQDQLSALWGRRAGNLSEFGWGKLGAVVNEIYLGEYEAALVDAQEAGNVLQRAGGPPDVAKALELEALASFYLGDYDRVESAIDRGLSILSDGDYVEVKPRILWMRGRVAFVLGDHDRSAKSLTDALRLLQENGQPEDLLGIEIELLRVRAEIEDPAPILGRIHELLLDGGRRRLPIVHGQAALAIAEIAIGHGLDAGPCRSEILSALEWAEQVGMVEFSWMLSYRLGQLAAWTGDVRIAQTRFTHAQRILRRTADSLGPVHKRLFLSRPDITDAIAAMTNAA